MKAEYIIRSLEAMEKARVYLENHCHDLETARQRGALKGELFCAGLDLKHASGLTEVEVSIEKEPA